jgi:plastocyanin
MRARLTLSLTALALALGALVATEMNSPVAAQSAPVAVGLGAMVFEPAELSTTAGAITFNLTNTDTRRHNMVIDVAGVPVESEVLSGGAAGVFDVTIDQAGEYEFYCNLGNHREQGMVGKLMVQ